MRSLSASTIAAENSHQPFRRRERAMRDGRPLDEALKETVARARGHIEEVKIHDLLAQKQ
jgi:hypothetical protein